MKPQIESGDMVIYQFEIDDDLWNDWKETVPRTKSLDRRIIELIEADAEGRVERGAGRDETEVESASVPRSSASDPKGETPEDHRAEQLPVTESERARLKDELAGSGDLLERRVDAILAMYDVLRERGQAENDDLLEAVDVDATGYQDETSVWSNMVKGSDTLRALPGVEAPGPGRTVWRYNEEEQT